MPPAVLLTLMLAQELPAEAGDAAKLERIRRALAEPPAITVTSAPREGPVFRVTILGPKSDRPVWEERSAVPSYIRPSMPIYQYEFLQKVTPELFRGATLHPVGVPMVPLLESLRKQIGTALRKSAEARAREELRLALEQLLACRHDPARPGCER